MTFWIDKQGNKLTFKEFMGRWKEGIASLTPLQQVEGQLKSTYIMLFGIFAGLIFSFFYLEGFWWGTIILVGALLNTIFTTIGLYQKYKALKNIQEQMNKALSDLQMKGGDEREALE